jgi:hypothetical protein
MGNAAPFLTPPPLLTYPVRGKRRGRRGAARVLPAAAGGVGRGEGGGQRQRDRGGKRVGAAKERQGMGEWGGTERVRVRGGGWGTGL